MHIYTHKSIQATKTKYYQNIYSLMMESSGVIFGFVSVVIPYVFSKYCSMNLYNLYNDKKLFVSRLEREQTRNLHLKTLSIRVPGPREAELPKTENCGHLCPLLSTFSKYPVILHLLLAGISREIGVYEITKSCCPPQRFPGCGPSDYTEKRALRIKEYPDHS